MTIACRGILQSGPGIRSLRSKVEDAIPPCVSRTICANGIMGTMKASQSPKFVGRGEKEDRMKLGTFGKQVVRVESTCSEPPGAFALTHPLTFHQRSPAQVAVRLDHLIADIKNQLMHTSSTNKPSDVVCVAHSHILSAFALRWVERPLEDGIRLLLDTAGVAVLRYVPGGKRQRDRLS